MIASSPAKHYNAGHCPHMPWSVVADRLARSDGRTPERNSRQARIQAVLGDGAQAVLPGIDPASLARYHRHLSSALAFPFDALYFDEHEGATCDNLVTVTRLLDPGECLRNPQAGIQCEVLACGHPVTVRLDEVRIPERGPRQETLDDYRHWLQSQR